MSKRSPESQALHDGFERYVLPILGPLGFKCAEIHGAVGWTAVAAECVLPSGARVRVELEALGKSSPRFRLHGPSAAIELMCTETDPAYPKRSTVAHSLSHFETIGEAAKGGEVYAARRRMGLEFLALEIAATSDQLVRAIPEMRSRVEAARETPSWRCAAERAHAMWTKRNVRSEAEERPVEGKFQFIGSGLAVVEAGGERFTFRFDTSSIDRTVQPIVSGWLTTPAGTQKPSKLVLGELSITFDPSGKAQ